MFRMRAAAKALSSVEMLFDLVGGAAMLSGDEGKMRQVLDQSSSRNAVKFTQGLAVITLLVTAG